jgi:hypothetical protein
MSKLMWPRNLELKKIIALSGRKERAKTLKQVDNSALYAGSPMYYYCHLCGLEAAVLPETHQETPPKYCKECQEMVDHGYSPEKQQFR